MSAENVDISTTWDDVAGRARADFDAQDRAAKTKWEQNAEFRRKYGKPVYANQYEKLKRDAARRELEGQADEYDAVERNAIQAEALSPEELADRSFLRELRVKHNLPPRADLNGDGSPEPQTIRIFTATQLVQTQFPEREYILYPVIRQKDQALVYSLRGVGKTRLATGVSIAAASGGAVLRWTAPKPRRVLHVDGEMAIEELKSCIEDQIKGSGLNPGDNLRILAADAQGSPLPSLATKEGQALIDQHLDNADLLTLDNQSTLMYGLEENDALAWEPVQHWLLDLKRRGVTTLLACHAGKSGEQRGTSKKEDTLNVVFRLEKPSDYEESEGARFIVRLTKHRGLRGHDVEAFEAWLQDNPDKAVGGSIWTMKRASDADQEIIESMSRDGASLRAIASAIGMNHTSVRKRIGKAKRDGRL